MPTVVLSVRIRKELKEEAERYGINIKEVIEKSLEKEIRKAKAERLKRIIEEALNNMDVSAEEWVRHVKETRYER